MREKRTPSLVDWAWIAGLFEGEGTISFNNTNGVSVVVQMTDRDVLERLDTFCPSPSGLKRNKQQQPHHKPQFIWYRTRRDEVTEFLEGVLPWLGERRGARAREALVRLDGCRGSSLGRDHCLQGHPLTGENLYRSPQGRRICRACRRAYDREWRLARAIDRNQK